jgi:hypothetical protein
MATPGTVVTGGYGPGGSPALVLLIGFGPFGSGSAPAPATFPAGGSWMLRRLRATMPRFRSRADLRRVTYFPRTAGDTYVGGVGYWARREPERRAMEDGLITVRAVWHLYRVDDPLQTVVPTPMGKIVDDEGVTWLIPIDGQVTRGYRDPEINMELKFDFETVLQVT